LEIILPVYSPKNGDNMAVMVLFAVIMLVATWWFLNRRRFI